MILIRITALWLLLLSTIVMVVFGLVSLENWIWPSPAPLLCVKAHDEFHQTDNGTLIKICDRYERKG